MNISLKEIASDVKKRKCCLLVYALFYFLTSAQSQTRTITDTSVAIREKLVQLALQGPEAQKIQHQNKIEEYKLKAAQNVWMNLLAFNINYNELSFSKTTPTSTYVYPRYNLGLSVPLGAIFSRTAVKSAKENLEIRKDNAELLKADLRQKVLTAYEQYQTSFQLISLQNELVNDTRTQLTQSEEKFRSGKISLEAYYAAQRNLNTEQTNLIKLKLQQDLYKLEIEKLIGIKLEAVTRK